MHNELRKIRWNSRPDFTPAIQAKLSEANPYVQCKRDKDAATGQPLYRKLNIKEWFGRFVKELRPTFFMQVDVVGFIVHGEFYKLSDFYDACLSDCLRWSYNKEYFYALYEKWVDDELKAREQRLALIRKATALPNFNIKRKGVRRTR